MCIRDRVLAVIKYYVETNNVVTISEINQAFNMYGKCKPVVASFDEALKIDTETGHARHFLKADEVIQLNDLDKTLIAVNSQWGTGNIDLFLSKVKENNLTVIASK